MENPRSSESSSNRWRHANHLTKTLLLTLIAIGLASIWAGSVLERNSSPSALRQRVVEFQNTADRYNLIFIGDSRTYCGIHPEHIDPLLGTRSINLATFTHWFPTQFSMINDLGESLRGKTVVWTVGHQNFTPSQIQFAYPIGLSSAWDLVQIGVPTTGLIETVARSHKISRVYVERGNLRQHIRTLFRIPAPNRHSSTPSAEKSGPKYESTIDRSKALQEVETIRAHYRNDPNVVSVDAILEGGTPTSVVLMRRGGGYERIEIDARYFRWRQSQLTPAPISEEAARDFNFVADSRMLNLFEHILATYKRYGVKLIVNEVEEAGFTYPHPLVRQKYREFMHDFVQTRVESAGFKYVRTDLDRLVAEDFFDYNHLNSIGITKYSPMLAKALRPYAETE